MKPSFIVGRAVLLLIERGGALAFTPGSDIAVSLRGHDVKPFALLPALSDGRLSAEAWAAQCRDLGIAGSGLAAEPPAVVGTQDDHASGARASA